MWLRLLVLSVFVTACGAPVLPDLGPTIRVMTFDVNGLFDTSCGSGLCDRIEIEGRPTQAQFDAQVAALAAGIRSTGPDLVVLQGIENQVGLDALSAKVGDILPGATLGEAGAPWWLDVAVLARVPIGSTTKHRGTVLVLPDFTTTTFTHEFYEVHVQLEGREVIVFAAAFHHRYFDDAPLRLAEAQAAHSIVVETANAHPDALVLLAGDLQDYPGSAPIEALESDGALIRVARDLPVADQVTYSNHKGVFGTWVGPSALDHIFRATRSPGSTVPGSVKVLKTSTNPGQTHYAGSDHCALQADFYIR